MPSLGWQELVIVLIIVVIIFGAGKLPEIGGAMGKSIKEFKKEAEEAKISGDLAEGTSATSASNTVQGSAKQPVEARQVRADEI